MVTEKGISLINRETGEIIKPEVQPLMISPEYIQRQQQSLALLHQLTQSVLVEGRDFGSIPGIPGKCLWDPGASLIIGAFNCHVGERRIIQLRDDSEMVTAVVEVPIINNATGVEVGSGIGASSTQETKHKYRWVESYLEWGFNEEAAKQLKSKVEDGKTRYRIPNPERGELLNIIVKQASKRAEVDAAQGLPGAGSALRELLDPRARKSGAPARKEPDWAGFWGRIAQMGLGEPAVHDMLEVKSIKDWLDQGKTLDDAIRVLAQKITEKVAGASQGGTPPAQADASVPVWKRNPSTIKTLTDLYKACNEDFTVMGEDGKPRKMQPADVLKELGYKSQLEIIETPEVSYRTIASLRG